MQKETILHLENRGGVFLYHFIYFNLIELYHIKNEKYNIIVTDHRETFPSTDITFPVEIHMNNINQFQKEAFEIIKDKFILINICGGNLLHQRWTLLPDKGKLDYLV